MLSKSYIRLFFVAGIIIMWSCFSVLQAQNNEYVEELRGVWITNVDSDVLFEKDNIAEGMDFLAERGFNVIYPVVWNKGFTLFPSDVAEEAFGIRQDPVFVNKNRDPLAEIITEAHRVGIEVIPWFEYGFASIFGDQTGGHIIQENPHWAAIDADGNIVVKNGFYWMNSLHPEVQQFMLDLILEVIEKYDIDGIQGDDRLPAMPSEAGYSEFTRQLYADEHDGNEPPSQYNDADYLQWKADKLTTFAGKLFNMVKEADNELTVSLSPSIYPWSLQEYLQDWPTWLDSSYVDIIHPQAYRNSVTQYEQIMRNMLGQQPFSSQGYIHRSFRPQIFPGVLIKAGSQFNGPGYVLDVIEFNREYDIKGEVYFFYEGLDEKNDNLGDTLRARAYQQQAILPNRNGQVRRPVPQIKSASSAQNSLTGSWTDENTPDGFESPSLKGGADEGTTFTFNMDVPRDAWYHVVVWNPVDEAATTAAQFTINGENEIQTAEIDQTDPVNNGWITIGNVFLTEGTHAVVELDAGSAPDSRPSFISSAMLLLDRKQSPNVQIDAVITSSEALPESPEGFELHQNFPNPFNPTTNIRFSLPATKAVTLEVFNMLGQRVAMLADNEFYSAGTHSVTFNANGLASGLYLYRLQINGQHFSKKMILMK